MCRDGRCVVMKNRALRGQEVEMEYSVQVWKLWVSGLLRWASDPAILLKLVAGRQRGKRVAAEQ